MTPNRDDYANRQATRDREYAAAYETPEVRQWLESLGPEERRRLESEGLLKPMIDRRGGSVSEDDIAESPLASYEPDIIGEIDRGDSPADTGDTADHRSDTLASFCARIRSAKNPLLVFDAVCFATGVLALDGESQTELAKRHGVSRAAFSKIATQWCKTFGIKPSRGMKSEKARKAYERRAKADWKKRAGRKSAAKVDAALKT